MARKAFTVEEANNLLAQIESILVRIEGRNEHLGQAEHHQPSGVKLQSPYGLRRREAAELDPLEKQCDNGTGKAEKPRGCGNHQEKNVAKRGADLLEQLFIIPVCRMSG